LASEFAFLSYHLSVHFVYNEYAVSFNSYSGLQSRSDSSHFIDEQESA
jgi:hypothetical protein